MQELKLNALRITRDADNSSTKIYVDDELAFDYKTNTIIMPFEWIVKYVYYRYFTFSGEIEFSDERRMRVLECLQDDFISLLLENPIDYKNIPYDEWVVDGVNVRINFYTKKGGDVIKREYTTLSEPTENGKVKKSFMTVNPIHTRPPKDDLLLVLAL